MSSQSHLTLFSPDISFSAVAFPVYHFRAHPVGGASDRLDSSTRHADGLDTFAGPKVPQLYVPRWVSQDISTWWSNKNKVCSGASRGTSAEGTKILFNVFLTVWFTWIKPQQPPISAIFQLAAVSIPFPLDTLLLDQWLMYTAHAPHPLTNEWAHRK